MLNFIFPHYTNRRFLMTTVARGLRSHATLRNRFVAENWRAYGKYRSVHFACNVCGERSTPFFDFPDLKLRREHHIGILRETLQCRHCGATMRHRTLAAMLLRSLTEKTGRTSSSLQALTATGLGGLNILDTDAFSPNSKLLRQVPGYVVSSFIPEKQFDMEIAPGHFNVNLENMGFASERFDLVLTSDVMEHVRGVDAAHHEIARILKPHGRYIFTVPYDASVNSHVTLVDTSGPQDIFLMPPHYHGDPLTGGILAYRIFGRQIFQDLAACGLRAEFSFVDEPTALIEQGDAFVAEKLA